MDSHIDLQSQVFCFLGKETFIKGDLQFIGETIIACRIEGDITMQSNDLLTFQREANIRGTIHCQDIVIKGTFEGLIQSQGKVIIYPTAKVAGELSAKQLVVLPGAQLNITGHTLD